MRTSLVRMICLAGFVLLTFPGLAQNEVPDSASATILMKRGVVKDSTYENYASGEFTPGRGFDMVKSKFGTLNISRYLNQLPGHQTWQDHLGRDRDFVGRNDFF
ncbi:MAG: hypothetical protein E6H09_14325 [Bacteroidetes bacterium]|nr:MAG: hypothetical protein E6H09_14325 [Bacteroidota bacterium]